MKDIYELLNDIDIDESEFEEMNVSKQRKNKKSKKLLRKSLIKKKKTINWKKGVLAASIIVTLSTATFGVTFPTQASIMASNIPIIGDIFKFFDGDKDGLYANYKEFSTEQNISEESNGITVTINDAVFDGKTISLTYSIESEHDLGEEIHITDPLQVEGTNGVTGGSQIKKVDENNYVGILTRSLMGHEGDIAKIKWNMETIINLDTREEFKGDWSFALALEIPDTHKQLYIDKSSEQDGVKVTIDEITVTPMSFIVNFNQAVSKSVSSQWDDVSVQLEIRDNLGNLYSGEGNGGASKSDSYDINWSATFESLNESATKLIVTPRVILRNVHSGGVELAEKGEEKTTKKVGVGSEEILLDKIIIELDK
ncbi:MAG: DUF4179 domain-containing protein [Bacillaceae bacterium]|nr:DUF4179 domain-containing protein [Bacillaceae bacterium]